MTNNKNRTSSSTKTSPSRGRPSCSRLDSRSKWNELPPPKPLSQSVLFYLKLFLKCFLFSIAATGIIMSIIDPSGTSHLLHHEVLPPLQKNWKRLHNLLVPPPRIYTLQDLNHKVPSYCMEISANSKLNDKGNIHKNKCRNLLSPTIKKTFEKDGVIAIRGLLSPDLLASLDESSSILVRRQIEKNRKKGGMHLGGMQFHTKTMGPVFLYSNVTDGEDQEMHGEGSLEGFRNVALLSLLPQIAAELLGLDYEEEDNSLGVDEDSNQCKSNATVRVLRDVFLTKDDDQYVCGWHVDDLGFWPATVESPGVNAWIAIDDMPSSTGGGLALSPQSHIAPWRHDAYQITGSIHTFPPGGFKSAKDMFDNRKGAGTCNLKTISPQLYEKMETKRRVYDIKKGDVIFHHRWIFHRTIPFEKDLVRQNRMAMKEDSRKGEMTVHPLLYRRYSVRYVPGTARLPSGYGAELSIMYDSKNAGRSTDEVGEYDGPWYPRCWPHTTSQEELEEIKDLALGNKMKVAENGRAEKLKEMAPYLKEIGKKQRDFLKHKAKYHGKENKEF